MTYSNMDIPIRDIQDTSLKKFIEIDRAEDVSEISFNSYNELLHTLIMYILYINIKFRENVTVIDTVYSGIRNHTYFDIIKPILVNYKEIDYKIRGSRIISDTVIVITDNRNIKNDSHNNMIYTIKSSCFNPKKTDIIILTV